MEHNPYYLKRYIQFDILEQTKNREIAILPLMRAAQIRNTEEFLNLLSLVNWEKKKSNFYISCAKLKKIPDFTFNMKNRSEFTGQWFQNDFDNEVFESDLFLDFDSDDFNKVKKEVKKIKYYLDKFKVPYQIIFSGNKGFHVVVDGKYIPIENIQEGIVLPHKEVIENIKEALDLETLDLSNNHLANRLRKLPYSLVLMKKFDETPQLCPENIMSVALPVSDEEFEKMEKKDYLLGNVMRKIQLNGRGNMERYAELPIEIRKENVIKFLKQFREDK